MYNYDGGNPPKVDFSKLRNTIFTIADVARKGYSKLIHDVSIGGLGVALAEISLKVGLEVDLSDFALPPEVLLFSESYGRALILTEKERKVMKMLSSSDIPFKVIGRSGGENLSITLKKWKKIEIGREEIEKAVNYLSKFIL